MILGREGDEIGVVSRCRVEGVVRIDLRRIESKTFVLKTNALEVTIKSGWLFKVQ
jgi:hypothetical protein